MSEEIKKVEEQIEPSNGKNHLETETPKDFKVAEIWIKDGKVCLDASMEFWSDRVRAIGLLEFCKEIVKTAKGPEEEKPKIITGSGVGALDYLRNRIKGKRK